MVRDGSLRIEWQPCERVGPALLAICSRRPQILLAEAHPLPRSPNLPFLVPCRQWGPSPGSASLLLGWRRTTGLKCRGRVSSEEDEEMKNGSRPGWAAGWHVHKFAQLVHMYICFRLAWHVDFGVQPMAPVLNTSAGLAIFSRSAPQILAFDPQMMTLHSLATALSHLYPPIFILGKLSLSRLARDGSRCGPHKGNDLHVLKTSLLRPGAEIRKRVVPCVLPVRRMSRREAHANCN